MNVKNVLEVMIYLGTVLILIVGGYLSFMTYLLVDEFRGFVDEDLIPLCLGAAVLALFMMGAGYVYGRFVIIPFEKTYEGGDQE